MAINANEFKEKVAQKLSIIAVGESVNADDGSVIGDKMTALERMLGDRDLLHVNFSAEIDAIYMEPLVSMVAAMCVDEFGVSGEQRVDLVQNGLLDLPTTSFAERQLRKILAGKTIARTVKSEYF